MPLPANWVMREIARASWSCSLYLVRVAADSGADRLRDFFIKMGFIRFMMLVNLLQFMAALPIKMILRWTINLKYIVYIPEYFFNI